MEAREVMRSILKIEMLHATDVSLAMGKSSAYLSSTFSRGFAPKVNTLIAFLDTIGYDLVVRRRKDGYELIVDPHEIEARKTQRATRRRLAQRDRTRLAELLLAVVELDEANPKEVSTAMGMRRTYLDQAIYGSFKGRIPRSDTLAFMLDGLGYDLLAHCRKDGFEILIDPKE